MFDGHADQEGGQGLMEYALIIMLVAIIVIAVLVLLGPFIAGLFDQVVEALVNPPSPSP
jgi:pilus assembly protein Flp/PilA